MQQAPVALRSATVDGADNARPGALRRTAFAWSVIGVMGLAALFIQPCGDHAAAAILSAPGWIFQCPVHRAVIVPPGEVQGS